MYICSRGVDASCLRGKACCLTVKTATDMSKRSGDGRMLFPASHIVVSWSDDFPDIMEVRVGQLP